MKTSFARRFISLLAMAVLIAGMIPVSAEAVTLSVCTRILYREMRRDCGKNSAGMWEPDCELKNRLTTPGTFRAELAYGVADLEGAVARVWHTADEANPANDTLLGEIEITERGKPSCVDINSPVNEPNIYLTFPWYVAPAPTNVKVGYILSDSGSKYDTFKFLRGTSAKVPSTLVVSKCGAGGKTASNGKAGCDYAAPRGYRIDAETYMVLRDDGYVVVTPKGALPKNSKAYPIMSPVLGNRRTTYSNNLASATKFLRRFGNSLAWGNVLGSVNGLFSITYDDTGLSEELLLLYPSAPRIRSIVPGVAFAPPVPKTQDLTDYEVIDAMKTLTRTGPIYGLALEWLRAVLTTRAAQGFTPRPAGHRENPVEFLQRPSEPMLIFCDAQDGLGTNVPKFNVQNRQASCRTAHGWAVFMAAASWWDPDDPDANPAVFDGETVYALRAPVPKGSGRVEIKEYVPVTHTSLQCDQNEIGCEEFVQGFAPFRFQESDNILQTARAFWDAADSASALEANADPPFLAAADAGEDKCRGEVASGAESHLPLDTMLDAWDKARTIWLGGDQPLWAALDTKWSAYSGSSSRCNWDENYYINECELACKRTQCVLNAIAQNPSRWQAKLPRRLRHFPSLHDFFQGAIMAQNITLPGESQLPIGLPVTEVTTLARALFTARCTYDPDLWFPSYFVKPFNPGSPDYGSVQQAHDVLRAQLAYKYLTPGEILIECPVAGRDALNTLVEQPSQSSNCDDWKTQEVLEPVCVSGTCEWCPEISDSFKNHVVGDSQPPGCSL